MYLKSQQIDGKRLTGRSHPHTFRAFTFVELLVVIAIVAMGMVVVVPIRAATKTGSKAIQCVGNLRQLQLAFGMYASDFGGQVVSNTAGFSATTNETWAAGWLDWSGGIPTGTTTNANLLLRSMLGSYTRTPVAYKCPSDTFSSAYGPRVRSYSMNGFVGGSVESSSYGYTSYRTYLKSSDFAASGPAQTFVFIDEHPDSINDGTFQIYMPASPSWPAATTWDDLPASSHADAGCLSFADGHVEAHKWLDPMTKSPVGRTSPPAGIGQLSVNDNRWLVSKASAPK